MARVRCRCGEVLEVSADDERVVCPSCGARIRVRRPARAGSPTSDGFIRFACPCGRRLKVRAANHPKTGRCPDCGKVVRVPDPNLAAPLEDPEARTEELDQDDVARLRRWAARHGATPTPSGSGSRPPASSSDSYSPPRAAQVEAGLRLCPKCGQPLHMNAIACPSCGAYTPKT